MKRRAQDELLSDLLAESGLAELQDASLQTGLKFLHQKRQRRRLRRALALGAFPVLLVGLLLVERSIRISRAAFDRKQQTSIMASARPRVPEVKLISDEELFALFPNRSLALVGKPGHQELVFLDEN